MDDQRVNLITDRYVELYEKVTGKLFEKAESVDILRRIEENILGSLNS